MSEFTVTRTTPLPVEEVWNRLTDWERHGDFIPLTKVTTSQGPVPGAGDVFVARTNLGPVHFDDPMEVTYWEPPTAGRPGVCRIVKRGNVVTGWAVLTVTATLLGTSIRWQEDARFRYVGTLLGWPNKVGGALIFGRLVDGLLGRSPNP